jgi:hypothetical protein
VIVELAGQGDRKLYMDDEQKAGHLSFFMVVPTGFEHRHDAIVTPWVHVAYAEARRLAEAILTLNVDAP